MFGAIGIFGSKGMARVPNLSGLSGSSITSAITAAGLVANNTGTTTTSNSSINGQVASQTPSASSLAEYGSTVSYTTYNYVAPCTPNWTVQTIYSNCTSCVRYSNDYHQDGCGNSYFDNPQGPMSCDSGEETLTDEYDVFISANQYQCYYRNTKVYTKTCTGATRYVQTDYAIDRDCPTCQCPAL